MLKFFLLCIVACFVINHTTYAQDVDMIWQNINYKNYTDYSMGTTGIKAGAKQIAIHGDTYVAVLHINVIPLYRLSTVVDLLDFKTGEFLKQIPIGPVSQYGYADVSKIFFSQDGSKLYLVGSVVTKVVMTGSGQFCDTCINPIDYDEDNEVIYAQSNDNRYIASAYVDEGVPTNKITIFDTKNSTTRIQYLRDTNRVQLEQTAKEYKYWSREFFSGVKYLTFSPSGRYLITNRLSKDDSGNYLHSNFIAMDTNFPSYHFDNHCNACFMSSDDMVVGGNDGITDLTRKHVIKQGFFNNVSSFLPGDNHILGLGRNTNSDFSLTHGYRSPADYRRQDGEVENISIYKVIDFATVKEYKVSSDNPGKLFIQSIVNSSFNTFVTLSDKGTITSWKIPTNLPKVKYKSSFTLPAQKSYSTWEKIDFSNTTYPYRRNAQYMWNFGDGTTSNEAHPTHIYTQPGTYIVKLVSTDLSASKGSLNTLVPTGVAVVNDSSTQTIVIAPSDVEESVVSGELVSNITISPNPFNEGTTIHYRLEKSSSVSLKITNIFGEVIASEEQDAVPKGEYHHSWNGKNAQNGSVPTGMYFCTISTGNGTQTIPLILLR